MYTTKSYAAYAAKKTLEPYQFTRRAARPTDVVIDIHYCGVCHSDIHQVGDEWGRSSFPMVPGHEITGLVSHVGSQVTRFKVGDPVGVGCLVNSCRDCHACHSNQQQYCTHGPTWTYNSPDPIDGTTTQGGYSDKIVVDEQYVLKIPSNLPLDAAAPLLCAGITLYSPLMHWQAGPSKHVAIIGLGGLGHIGVKLAHALGAHVTVLSHSSKKKDDAYRLGASDFFDTSHSQTFSSLQNKFDLILNTVSSNLDWDSYLNLLKLDGSMVIIGLPENKIPVNAFSLIFGRRHLSGSLIGGIQETQEMLDFCGKNNILCDIEKIAMHQINEAYARVLKSDVKYRFVIDMTSF